MTGDEAALRAALDTFQCPFCNVPKSTGNCTHIIDSGDGRITLSAESWGKLCDGYNAHMAALAAEEDA